MIVRLSATRDKIYLDSAPVFVLKNMPYQGA